MSCITSAISHLGRRAAHARAPGRRSRALLVATIALVTGATQLAAQAGTIAGTVVSEAGQIPIPEAQVRVAGTNTGAVTDASGRFRLTGLTGTEVSLEVRRLGYRPTTVTARVGTTDLRITIPERSVELDALVVTGTAGATEKRAIGNAVSTIKASEITQVAPVTSMQELLGARAPGVVLMSASGAVGTGSRVRVRGTSSLSLTNQPLLYIDGVRVNNQAATGPTGAQAFGSSSISRMNDINPDEIESIEIIKGPAAATLYGTEAANGVIQILTKRGVAGRSQWNLVAKRGANYLRDPEGRFPVNYQRLNATAPIESIDIVEREKQLGHPIWDTGDLNEYDLSMNGGTDLFRYFVSGGLENNQGVDPSNSVLRHNGRANLSLAPHRTVTLNVSTGYITGKTRLACEAGCGGRVWGTILANPNNLVGAVARQRGFHSGTPQEYSLLVQNWQNISRFTGSVQLQHQPISWFSHRLNAGTDRAEEGNVSFTPRVDSLIGLPAWGNTALGGKSLQDRNVHVNTVDYAATATFDLLPSLRSQTSVGGQFYNTETAFVSASGNIFPAPGLTSVSATTIDRTNTEDREEEKSLGFFAQQQFGWKDRVFVTVGLRSDDHSAFGRNFDRVYYPKFSGSWVVSEEPFWNLRAFDALKFRAAYGRSGQQPVNFDALRTYTPITGPNDAAAATPQNIGNPDLGPERGEEFELGFDAGLFSDRVGVEFTYYNKKTKDAILNRQIAPSLGFPGNQPFNAGAIRNTGIEMLVRGQPWNRGPVTWDLSVSFATNDNEILSLGPPACADPLVANVPAGCLSYVIPAGTLAQRHHVGYPVGGWFEQKVLSAEFGPDGRTPINVQCADGRGGSMLCTGADGRFGTPDDAPDIYLGRTVPKLETSLSNTLTLWKSLRLYGLVDYKGGYRKLDGNSRARCSIFFRCRENFYPEEFDPKIIAQTTSSSNLVDYWFDKGDFVRLREVSATYTIPSRYAARMRAARASVSLAGRNLGLWTDYGKRGGLDPEAFFLSGSRGGQALFEQTTMPQLSQWVVTVNLGF
jgi:TonB-linked SusC/RagA family outer membrane protein